MQSVRLVLTSALLGAAAMAAAAPALAQDEESPFPNPFEDGAAEEADSPFAPENSPFGDSGQDDAEEEFRNTVEGDRVVLRALNKVTAATQDFTVNFDDPLQFGSLTVVTRYCSRRPPELIPETFVFLEIYDRTFDGAVTGEYGQQIFSGWMLGSSPALHGLEHPVYDVWPVTCLLQDEPDTAETPGDVAALESPAPLDEAAEDDEIPAD